MFKFLPLAALLALAPGAQAADVSAQAQGLVADELRSWAQDPEIIAAIEAQNTAHAGFDAAKIDALDKVWRAEVGAAAQPTIAPVLGNAASDTLRAKIDASQGRFTEAFVMDNLGLNVATAYLTSDYWQGDEEKFTATYGAGPQAVHVSEVEFDESTQTYQVQISFTVTDPASGAAIGAMTVAVDAEQLN